MEAVGFEPEVQVLLGLLQHHFGADGGGIFDEAVFREHGRRVRLFLHAHAAFQLDAAQFGGDLAEIVSGASHHDDGGGRDVFGDAGLAQRLFLGFLQRPRLPFRKRFILAAHITAGGGHGDGALALGGKGAYH